VRKTWAVYKSKSPRFFLFLDISSLGFGRFQRGDFHDFELGKCSITNSDYIS